MKSKKELLNDFKVYYDYIASIEKMPLYKWDLTLGDGKWTVKESIGHMMFWDERYFKNGIERIYRDEPVTLQSIPIGNFNDKARGYSACRSNYYVLNLSLYFRREIIKHLESISEDDYGKNFNGFNIYEYLEDFIEHDSHHLEQLKKVL